MAAVAATLSRSMKFEQLRAEVELLQAGHQHDQRRTTGSRRRATDADKCKDLGSRKGNGDEDDV
jgi:hypothetical protein